jgi:SAM-dependent methyltransferase
VKPSPVVCDERRAYKDSRNFDHQTRHRIGWVFSAIGSHHSGKRIGGGCHDEIYSKSSDIFSAVPNALMVRTITGRKPGRALDAAMGQGRNALWPASQGWAVTGFDISPVGIEVARKEAENWGLLIDLVAPYEDFNWGKEKWDLILFSYFFPQGALPKVWDALRPGGLILVEGFHIDTARVRPVGGGYHSNELFQVLKNYRMLIYEDVQDRQEWGLPYGYQSPGARPCPKECTFARRLRMGRNEIWARRIHVLGHHSVDLRARRVGPEGKCTQWISPCNILPSRLRTAWVSFGKQPLVTFQAPKRSARRSSAGSGHSRVEFRRLAVEPYTARARMDEQSLPGTCLREFESLNRRKRQTDDGNCGSHSARTHRRLIGAGAQFSNGCGFRGMWIIVPERCE